MPIASDISVAVNGDIRYIGDAHGGASPGYYTVLELHRFLMDLYDNGTESGDDLLSIIRSKPSQRETDNIITLLNGYNIDATLAEHLYDGSITQNDGDDIYAGLTVVGTVESGTEPMVIQNDTILTSYWGTGLNVDAANTVIMKILVQVRSGGSDIDGKRLRVQARELGDTYAEFSVNMGLGNNVAAISTTPDLNNQTAAGTIATWSDIANVEGYQTINLGNGAGAQPYYSQWDRGSRTVNQLYERTKWIARRGTSSTIHGINGARFRGVTHQWNYDNEASGPFQHSEILSWGTGATAGTGLLLALLDSGSTGTMWIQLLTGVVPADNATIMGGTSSATCLVNGSVTQRTVSPTFFGVSTGSAIIGAFGIGVESADLTSADRLTDLLNASQQPPNNRTFTVSGLVSGEDRVLVAPNDGSDGIEYDQFTADGAQSAGAGTFDVNEAIPGDTPASGYLRIYNGTTFERVHYSAWAGSQFTIDGGGLPSNVSSNANAFLGYIDELAGGTTASYTAIYSSDRSLIVKVNDGGVSPIKPFESPATFGASGGAVTAIRTGDV